MTSERAATVTHKRHEPGPARSGAGRASWRNASDRQLSVIPVGCDVTIVIVVSSVVVAAAVGVAAVRRGRRHAPVTPRVTRRSDPLAGADGRSGALHMRAYHEPRISMRRDS